MKTSARIAGIVFVALSLIEVFFLVLRVETVHPIVKPLLIPSLAVAALCCLLPEQRGRNTVLLAVALALHTAGDVLLLLDSGGFIYFAAGLGCFLLGHVCYLVILLNGMGALRGWKEFLCLLVPPVIALVCVSFFEVDGALRVVLVVYALLLLYVTSSGALWLLRGRKMGWRILVGGLLFVASDAVLALNAFNDVEFGLRHAVVMGTYLAAEWLIVSGIVRDSLSSRRDRRSA